MARQHTSLLITDDESAAHYDPASEVHLAHHLASLAFRRCKTAPLDLPPWLGFGGRDVADIASEQHAWIEDADGFHLSPSEFSMAVSTTSLECSTYRSRGRARRTVGLRPFSVPLPPYLAAVTSPADSALLSELAGVARIGFESIAGFRIVAVALSLGDEAAACHLIYRTVGQDRCLIRPTTPGLNGKGQPLRLGDAAVATMLMAEAGVLEPQHATWASNKLASHQAKGKAPVDLAVGRLLASTLGKGLEAIGRKAAMDEAITAYKALVATAVAQALDPAWRTRALEKEIADLRAYAYEIGAPLPKSALLDAVETAANAAAPFMKNPAPPVPTDEEDPSESSPMGTASIASLLDAIDKPDIDQPRKPKPSDPDVP